MFERELTVLTGRRVLQVIDGAGRARFREVIARQLVSAKWFRAFVDRRRAATESMAAKLSM